MGRSRDAWLAAIAAVLGIGEASCKRDAASVAATNDVPSASATTIVTASASAPSASATEVASATPSAAPSEIASAKPVPTGPSGLQNLHAACGARPQMEHSNICGAVAPKQVTATINTTIANGIADDQRTVAMMRARFRNCANRGLAIDPTEQGKVQLVVAIGANGDVTSASVASSTGLSSTTASCMAAAVRTATFTATSSARTIQIDIQSVRGN